ncbi:hypothetical protein CKO28_04840 [Rhodovibrio sodomensis]|uniref:histidine kinase n=1 Tax=Rhodovibrio sodomensis TaxID=1088 RepID=A0ABS1DD76_9PROT|nr:HAMP domain-containing sensor histidine kinase [Rhodovibrio sodomensis]MBK1667355.1 hypothetical protein [Rhodovibrio sodomensis]
MTDREVEMLVEALGGLSFETDRNGRLLTLGPEAAIHALDPASLVGQPVCAGPSDCPGRQKLLDGLSAGDGTGAVRVSVGFLGLDSPCAVTLRPCAANDATGMRFRGYAVPAHAADRRGQTHAPAHLEAISRLAGGVAHQMNNALQPILLLSEHHLDEVYQDAELRESLLEIRACAVRASAVVNGLLEFSRQEPARREPRPLAGAVAEALDRIVPGIDGLDHPARVLPEVGDAAVDSELLARVVEELLRNAVQEAPAGSSVTVRLTQRMIQHEDVPHLAPTSGPHAEISIEDRGPGMPRDVAVRSIDPFFTTHPDHAGLGLSVAHALARRMGGWLSLRSRDWGGTHAVLMLPLNRAPSS